MNSYEIVAFYRNSENEIADHAVVISTMYHLEVRYEKAPVSEVAISALLKENTVLCIFGREIFSFRKLMKYVYAIQKPTIIVHRNDNPSVYNHLRVPVGYLQENKEKVVWANFFQRHNPDSEVELIIPKEKDEHIAHMVANNVAFIENIFLKSGAKYKKVIEEGSFEKNLRKVFQLSNDCIVFIMRPFRIFSFYIPYNLRLFRKYAHTPVMIIPRDDKLYVPCH